MGRSVDARLVHVVLGAGFVAAVGLGGVACKATPGGPGSSGEFEASGDPGTGGPGAGQGGGATTSGEGGGFILDPGAGGSGSGGDDGPVVNPCASECGPEELCDGEHAGADDDCDGVVDEGCPCVAGQAQACFMGDPSYRNTANCFDGTQKCSENGDWGPCNGGQHATAEQRCWEGAGEGCHAIQAVPFQNVDLLTGIGSVGGSDPTFTVTCPDGVNPCPAVTGTSFQPLQSGQYQVDYAATGDDGETIACSFPLFVGAPGLRVELEWEHDLGGSGVDLDLHLHQPGTTTPWSLLGLGPQDCGFGNCTVSASLFGMPTWFEDNATPPDPVNWYKDPVESNNLCYYAPRGMGDLWKQTGKGCHNPRLDLDNITCDPTVTDVNSGSFCAPENINVDYPPTDAWFRVGVYYYSSHSETYPVHPTLKIYCDGALAAELGPQGFYDPEQPLAFQPSDGSGDNKMWLAADVRFQAGQCQAKGCEVVPLYGNPDHKTPLLLPRSQVESSFGPAYPSD